MKKTANTRFLYAAALIIILLGAVGSFDLMINASRNQKSFLLVTIFGIWVLSPFIGLLAANAYSRRWQTATRMIFYFFILIITTGSLLIYSGNINFPDTKNAFRFLMVPVISWILIVAVFLSGMKQLQGGPGKQDQTAK